MVIFRGQYLRILASATVICRKYISIVLGGEISNAYHLRLTRLKEPRALRERLLQRSVDGLRREIPIVRQRTRGERRKERGDGEDRDESTKVLVQEMQELRQQIIKNHIARVPIFRAGFSRGDR